MNCNCIAEVNKELAKKDLALDTTLILSGGVTLSMSTHWTGKKPRGKKPTTLIVNYCPFCGEEAAIYQNGDSVQEHTK